MNENDSARYLRYVKKYLESDELTERQRETIQLFDKHKVDLRHWKSLNTRLAYAKILYYLGRYCIKPYEDMTKEDIINFLDSKNINETTRTTYIIQFRNFFRLLYGLPEGNYPPCISDLKRSNMQSELTKSDLINDDEMMSMITCAPPNHRDPAIAPVLKETCFRPSEFLSMNVGDVEEKSYGFWVSCRESKTVLRGVPLIWSARYLGEWLNHHPYRDDPEKPLWISLSRKSFGKRLDVLSLNSVVQRIARRAGIKKRVYPYLFRHTGATYYVSKDWNEAKLRKLCGWKPGSSMPSRYTHLAGVDLENAALELHGIKKKPKTPLMASKFCPRCDEENGPEMIYCGKCATNLDIPVSQLVEEKNLQKRMADIEKGLFALKNERISS